MEAVQFITYTPQQLEDVIIKRLDELLESYFKKAMQKQQGDSLLGRSEVADLLKVNLSTIHNWCKSGKLKPYGMGNRVYFLKSDIEKSLIPLHL
ncbi:helix-turn-helix domain-containing protein [Myroides sp. DW712]|uniref:helix-turn-helix domain-containing protein n=1 Tax=Myroides sp. DW712 TaxID=3389800 RepID=UPI00397A6D44